MRTPHIHTFLFWRTLALPVTALIGCLGLMIAVAQTPLHPLDPSVKGWLLVTLAVGGMVAAISACVRVSRSLGRPIAHLVEVARSVTHGRARHRISADMTGDFRVLADALNQMIEIRQKEEEKLKLAQQSLDLKVHARTAELWRANKALREEMEQRAKAERDLQQAQKMDALGQFAGAIAHDFNNLLTVILGGTDCALQQLSDQHAATDFLRTVRRAGESAAALTRPLLTFSRNEVLSVEPLDLNDSVKDAALLVGRLIGVNIEVRLDLASSLPPIVANANQLQQVLVNLSVNARDAMNGSGKLTMATETVMLDLATAARHEVSAEKPWVKLTVTDSGCGMDATTKARIFEPFFTTKPAGRGTGLGLATVFGIVKQANGVLEVESEVGVGTSFIVYLPSTEQAIVAASSEEVAAPTAVCGGETLLLVEDEDDIRELATMMLEGRGYTILSAPDAEQALEIAEKHAHEIRALITDVVMPRINGMELAQLLIPVIPGLRILFVSGHCKETVAPEALIANADYLQKPYRSETLLSRVDALLRAPEKKSDKAEKVPELAGV
jgi:signal transduction histidine kinase/ActR/RegA family two-component response regulator